MSATFFHRLADVQSEDIGEGTRVWQFSVVMAGAKIGSHCNIGANVFIESGARIGDYSVIKNGVQVWEGVSIGSHVFVGPNATFTNDRHPKACNHDYEMLSTVVEDDVSICANATILPGIRIGKGAVVGAGAVVTKDVKPGVTVVGNPAKPLLGS